MSRNPDIWLGWAQCAVAEGMTFMPPFAKDKAHLDCKDPDNAWQQLLAVVRERDEHERAGTRAFASSSQGPYDAQATAWAMELAYGSID